MTTRRKAAGQESTAAERAVRPPPTPGFAKEGKSGELVVDQLKRYQKDRELLAQKYSDLVTSAYAARWNLLFF